MTVMTQKSVIEDADRIVIKVGSALLVGPDGKLRKEWLARLAEDIVALRSSGTQVILVSSGAVALGRKPLGFEKRPERLEEAQAAAAVGQIRLAQAYQSLFDSHDIVIAQILVTIDDLEDRPRFLNARNTIEALLDRGAIPVINENDTVATTEIRFGDNDRLAARVAQVAGADTLILLSDIDGLYDSDPRTNPNASLIRIVEKITPAIEEMAGPPARVSVGSGGMVTKIAAAKIALSAGCSMIIMSGLAENPIKRLLSGETCTIFQASSTPLDVRKQWIQGMMAPQGFLHIDQGAVDALMKGASLLPAGVVECDGNFERGDLVAFISPDNHIIGQGLVSYSSSDTSRIQGKKMSEATDILGYVGRSALVHRDDLVLL
ncbi:glutamate 5-kinase [Kordiimonas pumila]|uniref:Glutamate 5-kinase n=1 Tax=Kordiimonas pumila TaxID=2161677 RepID=A0ABV7D6F9_9PROT|nr:glutamate 5-kinase [Kordiimonas pumila]